ncbi:MAG: DUF697 domain-containing protein [Alphaproteobacteria bacterium]
MNKIPKDLSCWEDVDSNVENAEDSTIMENERKVETASLNIDIAIPPEILDSYPDISEEKQPDKKSTKTKKEKSALKKIISSFGWLFFLTVVSLSTVLLFKNIQEFIMDGFAVNAIYGWAIFSLFGILIILIGTFIFNELKGIFIFNNYTKLRNILKEAPKKGATARKKIKLARKYINKYLRKVEKKKPLKVQRIRENFDLAGDDTKKMSLELERFILNEQDKKVEKIIKEEAANVFLGTAISPYGFLDGIIVLWRNVRMTKKIAQIYQVRPGFLGTLVIIKRIIVSVAIANLMQESSNLLFMGMNSGLKFIPTKGSEMVVQGGASAFLTVRVGMAAQYETRIVPLEQEKRIKTFKLCIRSLARIPRQVMKVIKPETVVN